jgi:hypothetical protein
MVEKAVVELESQLEDVSRTHLTCVEVEQYHRTVGAHMAERQVSMLFLTAGEISAGAEEQHAVRTVIELEDNYKLIVAGHTDQQVLTVCRSFQHLTVR